MINILNKKYKKNIKYKKYDTKKKLYNKLLNVLNCNDDYCISNYKNIFVNKNFDLLLKPKLKYGLDGPISTDEINKLMIQLEKKYKFFKYLGTVPLNFMDIFNQQYSSINFNKYFKKNKCLGIIINTQPLPLSGEHWITLFIDFRKNNPVIMFFDSLGKKPPKEIKKYIKKIKNDINQKKIEINYNTKKHQKNGNDCGVYGIYFIHSMIEQKPKHHFFKKYIPEKKMRNMRKKYFNTRI